MFVEAIRGIIISLKEKNIKIHYVFALFVLLLSWYFNLSTTDCFFVLFCIIMVISSEMINTCIEELCDYVDESYSEKIRMIKDISAGFVLLYVILSIFIGLKIFSSYI